MSEQVIIIGASGHGRVIADIVRKSGDVVVGFLDDDLSKENVLGAVCDCVKYPDKKFIIGIGNNQIRKSIAEKYSSLAYYTAIHPTAVISENVKIGKGTAVMANAVINTSSIIGEHCIINTLSVVEHDNMVGDYAHISPGAVLCGTVKVGNLTHIGANATVRNNLSICEDCVIGCGGVVAKDIEKSSTYIGVPVRELV